MTVTADTCIDPTAEMFIDGAWSEAQEAIDGLDTGTVDELAKIDRRGRGPRRTGSTRR